MPHPIAPDVQELIDKQMASGKYSSENELLRDALETLIEQDEDLAAVQEAIADFEAGDKGVPLDEAIRIIRARHGISGDE
jgi:Arc/MetJ-type ribon-helix-helix transcriptional regulator